MTKWLLCALLAFAPASAHALEGLRLGDTAPAFSLADLSGAAFSLDAAGAHPRVLIFWSTWSPRSLEVLQDFRDRHDALAAQGLEIVAINADGEQLDARRLQAVRDYVDRLMLPFPVLLDAGLHTYVSYGILALPSAIVVDAGGRIAYALGGYPETMRDELKDKVQSALRGGVSVTDVLAAGAAGAAVEEAAEDAGAAPAAAGGPESRCTLPRAFYCSMAAERQRATADPAIMAMRLSICRGDAAEAERMLGGVSQQASWSADLRFVQGSLLLLKGRTQEARWTFNALRRSHPQEGWGEWGLGMAALAEGDPAEALGHMVAAGPGGAVLPEAETAVLKYLEEYWRAQKTAPHEEQFIALFRELDGVRACYRKLGRG
jgi:peroxiredoxin